MKRDLFMKFSLLVLTFSLILGTGCGAARSMYKAGSDSVKSVTGKVRPGEKPILKKRVLVAPVMDQAGIGEEAAARLTKGLANLLKDDDYLLINVTEREMPSGIEKRSPRFGVVIDPALVKKAEERDMDVLITCFLNPFDVTLQKSGIWPFRKIKREVEISISVNALNIRNGTLFLTNIETKKIKTPEVKETEDEDKWKIDQTILDKTLPSILDDQASAILDALSNQPWTGKIIQAEGNTLRINGGKDIGINESMVFEVFGKGESIRSLNGREYYLLGSKVGEIKADEVMQNYSTTVPPKNTQFESGYTIRVKR